MQQAEAEPGLVSPSVEEWPEHLPNAERCQRLITPPHDCGRPDLGGGADTPATAAQQAERSRDAARPID